MKKYKLKRYNVLLFTFIILMFLELSFRILTGLKIGNIEKYIDKEFRALDGYLEKRDINELA